MDPLSITASILTLFGIGGQAVQAIKKVVALKGAPEIVLKLHNELSDLHLLTVAIQDVFQTVQASDIPLNTRKSVTSSLKLVNETLLELEQLHDRITSTSQTTGSTTTNINRSAWLAEQTHLKLLQKDFRSARLKLTSVLGTLTSSSLLHLRNEITILQTKLKEMQNDLNSTGTTTLHGLSRQESAIEDVQRKIEGLQAFQQHSLAVSQRNIEIKLDAILAAAAVRTALGLTTAPRQLSSARDTQPVHSVMVKASLVHWRCSDPCICVCHHRYTTRSPQILNHVFGLLFLGYAGLPIITPSCDVKKCHRASPIAVAAYFFPLWLLARVVSFALKISYYEGPQFSLRISRVIDGNSKIFDLIQRGKIDAVKGLLQSRVVSPFDISHTSGFTALMLAAQWCQPEICEILMGVGADPLQEHPTRGNVYDLALETVLRKDTDGDAATLRRLSSLFKSDEAVEKLGLTLLHRTVLGLNELNLGELLKSISKASIDQGDAQGRTALWWAAIRGDLSALTLLIQASADANKRSNQGFPALDGAIRAKNEACAWLLLDLESIRCTYDNPRCWTSLHSCCSAGLSATLLGRLISKGAEVDQPFENGATALHFAVQRGHNSLVKSLISHGANIDALTLIRENPLYIAIETQNAEGLQLLLTHRVDYHQLIHVDETLLHYAAIHADLECLRTLHSFDVQDLDVHARTSGFKHYPNDGEIKGRTAMEIAMKREDVTAEWREMFSQLVNDIEFPQSFGGVGVQREESEAFVDAVEHQRVES